MTDAAILTIPPSGSCAMPANEMSSHRLQSRTLRRSHPAVDLTYSYLRESGPRRGGDVQALVERSLACICSNGVVTEAGAVALGTCLGQAVGVDVR